MRRAAIIKEKSVEQYVKAYKSISAIERKVGSGEITSLPKRDMCAKSTECK